MGFTGGSRVTAWCVAGAICVIPCDDYLAGQPDVTGVICVIPIRNFTKYLFNIFATV